MALVKETGAGVPNANTYADDADFTAWAADRGIAIPSDATEREHLLIKAMDYLETLGVRYLGYRPQGQVLQWPRMGVVLYGYDYPDDTIPLELTKAQVIIAAAAQTIDLFPNASGVARVATHTTVGPITIEYSSADAEKTLRPIITQANALLNVLFGIGSGQLRVVRG